MKKKKNRVVPIVLLILLVLVIGGIVYLNLQQQAETKQDFAPAASASPTTSTTRSAAPPKWDAESQGHFITAGAADSHGRIWIGSEEQGLWMYDPSAGTNEWQHFGVDEGLGDDAIYAMAVDSLDRVWVGHLRHGVSVFNGKSWKNYDFDKGPLGQRVFKIAVCPPTAASGAGDVWIATNLGLARYSSKSDSWSYYTRQDGLPSDQPNAIAFASDGTIYVGTHCDGLAIASAAEDYNSLRHIAAVTDLPLTPTGAGLPSNVINAVAVTRDGTLFVGTDRGLARSTDHGATFNYMRGSDWIVKTQKSIQGPPKDWQPADGATLAEDYITAIAEDEKGQLWVGYRTKGFQCVDPKTFAVIKGGPRGVLFASGFVAIPGQTGLVTFRGNGAIPASGWGLADHLAIRRLAGNSPVAFPSAAVAPSADQLDAMTSQIAALNDPAPAAAYLGEDWATQGDWVGRYGRQQVYFAGYGPSAPQNNQYSLINVVTGPHNIDEPAPYVYYASKESPSPRILYFPIRGKRMSGEWNDGGWQSDKFGLDFQGPDLWFDVKVPEGMNRVSLYTCNSTGHATLDRYRDYIIEVKAKTATLEAAQKAPVLARARVVASQNPAYRTFILNSGEYWIRIASNYSHMAGSAAIFFDHADASPDHPDDAMALYTHGIGCIPPVAPPESEADSAQLKSARKLWAALDGAYVHAGAISRELPWRVLAYRAATAAKAPEDLLTNWRWNLRIWSSDDRNHWNETMTKVREAVKLEAATKPAGAAPSR